MATKKKTAKKPVANKSTAKKKAKATASARNVPEISPLKGTSVDDWAKKLNAARR